MFFVLHDFKDTNIIFFVLIASKERCSPFQNFPLYNGDNFKFQLCCMFPIGILLMWFIVQEAQVETDNLKYLK